VQTNKTDPIGAFCSLGHGICFQGGRHIGRGPGCLTQPSLLYEYFAACHLLVLTALGLAHPMLAVFITPAADGLTKQGNPLLRFLWSEAAIHAVRRDPELKHFYHRKLIQKGLGKARAAVARKLGIRMWIMLRDRIEYHEFCRRGQKQQRSGDACAGMPGRRYGAKVTG